MRAFMVSHRWQALAIVALAFGLRVAQLGAFSFWFDEAGQVLTGREVDAWRASRHCGQSA